MRSQLQLGREVLLRGLQRSERTHAPVPVGSGPGAVNNDQDRVQIGQILLICLGVLVAGLLWKSIMKFLTADIPASNIRSQLPELRQDFERVKGQSESRLAQETARLDSNLGRLKQQKETCQNLLKAV